MTMVYVALLLPFTDGSGETEVLGVYSTRDGAQARCWRALQALGYEQPTDVVACAIDADAEVPKP